MSLKYFTVCSADISTLIFDVIARVLGTSADNVNVFQLVTLSDMIYVFGTVSRDLLGTEILISSRIPLSFL